MTNAVIILRRIYLFVLEISEQAYYVNQNSEPRIATPEYWEAGLLPQLGDNKQKVLDMS